MVCELDRLGRSTRDLLNTLDAIGKAGASFRSLDGGWANTDTPHGKLMVTVLGGLAEFERHLILARCTEGRLRAKSAGIRFGRKPKLKAHQRAEALARRAAGRDRQELQYKPHDDCEVGGRTMTRAERKQQQLEAELPR